MTPSAALNAQAAEFEQRFGNDGCWPAVIDDALGGGFRSSSVRSLLWRAASGVLPLRPSLDAILQDWPTCTSALRREYEKLKDEVIVNPHGGSTDGGVDGGASDGSGGGSPAAVVFDPLMSDPLSSQDSNNPWLEFHQVRLPAAWSWY